MLLDAQFFKVFRSGERFILEQEFPDCGACYIGACQHFILQDFFFFLIINDGYL